MGINLSCPITGRQRDNTTARVVAGLVFAIGGAALAFGLRSSAATAAVLCGLLLVDFIIRAFLLPKYSLLAVLGRGVVSGLQLPRRMADSGPKIFAARIGVLFTLGAGVLYGAGNVAAGSVVLVVLLLCAGMEAFFGFCLGCWMYSLLPRGLGNLLARELLQ